MKQNSLQVYSGAKEGKSGQAADYQEGERLPQFVSAWLARRDAFEDLGSVAFGFDNGPHHFDFASFADQEGAADDTHEGAAHELFFLPRAELLDGFVAGIAEQGEIEILLGLERGLRFDGVGAHAQDGDAELVEIFFCVTKLGRFDRST